jgi:hypothetical protein
MFVFRFANQFATNQDRVRGIPLDQTLAAAAAPELTPPSLAGAEPFAPCSWLQRPATKSLSVLFFPQVLIDA